MAQPTHTSKRHSRARLGALAATLLVLAGALGLSIRALLALAFLSACDALAQMACARLGGAGPRGAASADRDDGPAVKEREVVYLILVFEQQPEACDQQAEAGEKPVETGQR